MTPISAVMSMDIPLFIAPFQTNNWTIHLWQIDHPWLRDNPDWHRQPLLGINRSMTHARMNHHRRFDHDVMGTAHLG